MDFYWSVPSSLDILQPDRSSPTLGHTLLFRYHISALNMLSMPLSLPSPTLDLFGGRAVEGSSLSVSAPRVPSFSWVWVFWLDGIRADRRVRYGWPGQRGGAADGALAGVLGCGSAGQRRSPSDLQPGKTELSEERRVSVSTAWAWKTNAVDDGNWLYEDNRRTRTADWHCTWEMAFLSKGLQDQWFIDVKAGAVMCCKRDTYYSGPSGALGSFC